MLELSAVSFKQIRMAASVAQHQQIVVYQLVDQEPVWFDVAFPKLVVVAR